MTLQIWQMILIFAGGLATVVGSFYAARYTARSAVRVKELDVDGKAFERAEKIYVTSLDRLSDELKEHRETSAKDIKELKDRSTGQDDEIRILRAAIEKVTGAFRVAVNFIEEVLRWDGNPNTRPRLPELLKEHLDPVLVARHNPPDTASAPANASTESE